MGVKLKVKQDGKWTRATLFVPLDGRPTQVFKARVSNDAIRRMLMRAGVEIGFSLKGAWRATKRIAKKVASKKVIRMAKKALPIAAAVLPPPANAAAATVATGFKIADHLGKAAKAQRSGTPKGKAKAAVHVALASRTAQRFKKTAGRRRARQAMRSAAKVYRLRLTPA